MTWKEITETIDPHGGLELELMLAGEKPAALLKKSQLSTWQPHIQEQNWIVMYAQQPRLAQWLQIHNGLDPHTALQRATIVIVSVEKWRAREIQKLFQDSDARGPERRLRDKYFHRRLGELLGYSPQDIEEFIQSLDQHSQSGESHGS